MKVEAEDSEVAFACLLVAFAILVLALHSCDGEKNDLRQQLHELTNSPTAKG